MSGIVLRTLISTSWYVGETVLPKKEVTLTLVWGKGNGMMCSSFHLVVLTQESPWEPPPPAPRPTLHYRLCLGMLRIWVTDTPLCGCRAIGLLPFCLLPHLSQVVSSGALLLHCWDTGILSRISPSEQRQLRELEHGGVGADWGTCVLHLQIIGSKCK